MHRFDKELNLTPLSGLEVTQVGIGQNEVILNFHPEGSIRLEGSWILRDGAGLILDYSKEHSERQEWRLPMLLGRRVTRAEVRDEKHLDVHFATWTLEIEDDSDHYETCAIEHPSIRLYV